MFKKILIGTDFSSPSRAALHAGLSLAEKCMARLDLLHVVTLLELMYNSSRFLVPDSEWETELRKKLDEFFPKNLYPNSDRRIVSGKSVSQEIVNYARENSCGLITVGTRGFTAIGNLLIGSVAQQLVRISEIPVMVVRDWQHAETPYQGFSRVLVPTDFSDTAQRALRFGIELANFLRADLHLVHVVDLPEIKEISSSYPSAEWNFPESCELNVDSVLRKCLENKDLIGEGIVASLVGDPAVEILKYAERERIDFLAMGTHGKKGLERILLGSVASGVISKSKIPVITISPNL